LTFLSANWLNTISTSTLAPFSKEEVPTFYHPYLWSCCLFNESLVNQAESGRMRMRTRICRKNTIRRRRAVSKSIYVTTCFVASLDELDVACFRAAAIKSVSHAFTRYTQVSPSPFVPLGDTSYVTSIPNQYNPRWLATNCYTYSPFNWSGYDSPSLSSEILNSKSQEAHLRSKKSHLPHQLR
jgi:hypothetical protein